MVTKVRILQKTIASALSIVITGCTTLPSRPVDAGAVIYREDIEVEIQGAVGSPGTYTLSKKATLKELIDQAKVLPDADVSMLNMNQKLSHNDVIVIEVKKEVERISINTGSLEQLQKIPGIGPVTAQAIIDYRELHGLFQSIEELDHIKGIGPKKFAAMKDFVKL